MSRSLLLFFMTLLFAPQGALAAGAGQAVPAGEPILKAEDSLKAFELVGKEMDRGEAKLVKVAGQPFTEALRMTTTKQATTVWNVQVHAQAPREVKNGDVMLAQFYLRSVSGGGESAEGLSVFVYERNEDPWTKSSEFPLVASREWKTYSIPFQAKADYPQGKGQVCFRMGYRPQVIELADFQLTYYGSAVDPRDLPRTRTNYKGREWDAPWRKEALARIQKLRKGDLTVEVKDASGKPLPGAAVMVAMTRHAFPWGTAMTARRLAGYDMDPERYKKEFLRNFNAFVFENDLKWEFWEAGLDAKSSSWRREWVDDALDWADRNHVTVKGHNLQWPSWKWSPPRLKKFEKDPKAMREESLKHIREEASALKGRLTEWDVINEPVHEHDLIDLCGKDVMVEWFKAAREADPAPKLYINEYGILSGSGADGGTQDAYEGIIQYLLDNGAPLDGIGMQSHLGQTLTDPERILAVLDRFGKFGKEIRITEFDFDVPDDETLRYDYMKDYLISVFSHPSVTGFYMWGFWDDAQWLKMAPLYATDWTMKTSGKAWREMVYKEWWTRAAGKTNGKGLYSARGFLGDYDVTVSFGEKRKTVQTSLDASSRALLVVLK